MKSLSSKSDRWIFAGLFILSLALGPLSALLTARPAFAETPEEKAQKEEAKKALEAQKKLADWHKKAEDDVYYKYDGGQKLTVVGADCDKVHSQSALVGMMGDVYLNLSASVAGEVKKATRPAAAPASIHFLFWSLAKSEASLVYADTKAVNFTVDGKPLGPYTVKYENGKDSNDDFVENETFEMPLADFKALTAAKTVEGKLGETPFQIKDYQMILAQTFLVRLTPAPQPTPTAGK